MNQIFPHFHRPILHAYNRLKDIFLGSVNKLKDIK